MRTRLAATLLAVATTFSCRTSERAGTPSATAVTTFGGTVAAESTRRGPHSAGSGASAADLGKVATTTDSASQPKAPPYPSPIATTAAVAESSVAPANKK